MPKGPQRTRQTGLIGYWQDANSPGWPTPEVFVDADWSVEERDGVAAYLGAGRGWRHFMGKSTCRICRQPNGSSELTDGDWVWPEGLAHYVAQHAVRLPDEFVRHAPREKLPNHRRLPRDRETDTSWWKAQVPRP